MKRLKRVGCLLMAMVSLGATALASACGDKQDQVVVDGKTVNIQVFEAGYGSDWIYELKRQFETVYADQGYKMNILTPSYDMKSTIAMQEMAQGADTTGIDLYITQQVSPNDVGAAGQYGILAEDIRQTVFNQKAIGYDGQEEDLTVGEKLVDGAAPWLVDDRGVMYAYTWAASAGGLVVNTKKLAKYGLDLPVTSNQLFDCFEKIFLGTNGIANSETSRTFPITYPQAAHYITTAYGIWQAQYDMEEYERFWSMQTEVDGVKTDMINDGYEVFKSDGIHTALSMMYALCDYSIATYGSRTQTLDQAQAALLKEKEGSVFYFCGDWYLNEVKLNYQQQLNDITFIRIPISSALGQRLFGAGSAYNLSDEKADEVLALIASLSDDSMDVADIVSAVSTQLGVNITEADALEVAKARNLYQSYGLDHMAYINKNAPAKDVAELVLRMMASDDFSKTFASLSNVNSPYTREANTESQYEFVRSASKITFNKYAFMLPDTNWSGLRKKIRVNYDLPKHLNIASDMLQEKLTIYYSKNGASEKVGTWQTYKDAAERFMNDNYEYSKSQWATWLERLG